MQPPRKVYLELLHKAKSRIILKIICIKLAPARQTAPLSFDALQEILPKPVDSQVLQEVEAVSLNSAPKPHITCRIIGAIAMDLGLHAMDRALDMRRCNLHVGSLHMVPLPGTLGSTPADLACRASSD